MSQLTRVAFENQYGTTGTTFPDNTTGQISEGDLRTFGDDIADSFYNITDDQYTIFTLIAARLAPSDLNFTGL